MVRIHRIQITRELFMTLFGDGLKVCKISEGLSEDAELIDIARIPGTNIYELLFTASSGVEVEEGQTILVKNPIIESFI